MKREQGRTLVSRAVIKLFSDVLGKIETKKVIFGSMQQNDISEPINDWKRNKILYSPKQ